MERVTLLVILGGFAGHIPGKNIAIRPQRPIDSIFRATIRIRKFIRWEVNFLPPGQVGEAPNNSQDVALLLVRKTPFPHRGRDHGVLVQSVIRTPLPRHLTDPPFGVRGGA